MHEQPTSKPLRFGRYTVLKLIGTGAMGKVYLAHDPVLKRQVAVKVISIDTGIDGATHKDYLTRFTIEAESSAKLHHPSIVAVYDAGQEDGIPWIAFQYVDGMTLDRLLKKEGPLPPKRAMYIALDIASALQKAHELGVIHRDVKPSNILIEKRSGTAMLMDFGVAKVPWSSLTADNKILGSPGYMSPEQIKGRTIDESSDMFSLGIVLYEMATGRHPFVRDTVQATMFATISGKYTPAGDIEPRIPTQLETLISMCLAKYPGRRITAGRLVRVLQSLLRTGDAAATRPIDRMGRLYVRLPAMAVGLRQVMRTARRAGESAATAYRRAAPLIAPVFRRIKPLYAAVSRRLPRMQDRTTVAVSAMACAAALVLLGALISRNSGHGGELYAPQTGLDRTGKKLVAAYHDAFAAGDLDSALRSAAALTGMRGGAGRGLFLRAVAECRSEDYDEALGTFDAAAKIPGAKKLFEKNRDYVIGLLMHALEKKRADEYLINILAHQFRAADHRLIREAVKDTRYWLRWNAVRVCEAGGRSVDMVEVYMLDLAHAGSAQTRIRAVKKLGELGDRRAIPALKRARAKGLADPFVSAAAAETLTKVFNLHSAVGVDARP